MVSAFKVHLQKKFPDGKVTASDCNRANLLAAGKRTASCEGGGVLPWANQANDHHLHPSLQKLAFSTLVSALHVYLSMSCTSQVTRPPCTREVGILVSSLKRIRNENNLSVFVGGKGVLVIMPAV